MHASNFKQLACDINWDEEALMSWFHWNLQDEVFHLLLSTSNPQIHGEAINRAIKYNNWLLQYCQNQHSWTLSKPNRTSFHIATSTNNSKTHFEVENMQIDAIQLKSLTP